MAGQIDLIYIDPPFATGDDFSYVYVPSADTVQGHRPIEKTPSIIEQKAYRDTWGRGLDGYLNWFSDMAQFACMSC